MKSSRVVFLFLSLCFILIVLKFLFFPANPTGKKYSPSKASLSENKKITDPPLIIANAIIIKPELLQNTISSTGSLKANEEVEIQAEVSGKIIDIRFEEGSAVKKGQLLFRLNDLDLQATLKKQISNLNLADENQKRQAELLAIQGISKQDYEIAVNTMESAKADIQFTKASIAKTYVTAPFSGRIGLRYVSPGAYVSQNTKIATIQQLNPLKLDFSIPEKYSMLIKIGDKVNFTVQGRKEIFIAAIEAIEPRIDIATRTLSIRALFDNSSLQNHETLLPGAFAKIDLILHSNGQAITVPTESLVPILKGTTLFLYHQGKVIQIPVQTGIRTDTRVEILEGIHLGDTVITSGLLSLKPGQNVKINLSSEDL